MGLGYRTSYMSGTDRSLRLSDEFDRALKKVAADCPAFEYLEHDIAEFIDEKFEDDEELRNRYEIPDDTVPYEYFDLLELVALYASEIKEGEGQDPENLKP